MKQSIRRFAVATVATAALGLSALSPLAMAGDKDMGEKAEKAMDSAGQATSDTWITTKVRASFAAEGELSALAIGVETHEGVVTLSGDVDTEAQRDLAIKVAEEIDGVKHVAADGLESRQ